MPPVVCSGHRVLTAPQLQGNGVARLQGTSLEGSCHPMSLSPGMVFLHHGLGLSPQTHAGDPRPGGDRGARDMALPGDAGVVQLPTTAPGWLGDPAGWVEAPGGDKGRAGGWVLSTASPCTAAPSPRPVPAAPSTARSRSCPFRQRLSWLLQSPKPHAQGKGGEKLPAPTGNVSALPSVVLPARGGAVLGTGVSPPCPEGHQALGKRFPSFPGLGRSGRALTWIGRQGGGLCGPLGTLRSLWHGWGACRPMLCQLGCWEHRQQPGERRWGQSCPPGGSAASDGVPVPGWGAVGPPQAMGTGCSALPALPGATAAAVQEWVACLAAHAAEPHEATKIAAVGCAASGAGNSPRLGFSLL